MVPVVTQMGGVETSEPGGDRAPRSSQVLASVRKYLRPVAVLLIGLPILVASVSESLEWLHRPFPGFFLMSNGVIPSVSGYRWPPNKSELFHSLVIAADGRPVSSNGDVYSYVATKPVGTPVTYTLEA